MRTHPSEKPLNATAVAPLVENVTQLQWLRRGMVPVPNNWRTT